MIELLRSGATAGEIALGCMHSIADRILEMDRLATPVVDHRRRLPSTSRAS